MARFVKAPYGNASEGGAIWLNLDDVSYVKVGTTAAGTGLPPPISQRVGLLKLEIGYPGGPVELSGQAAQIFLEAFESVKTQVR